MLLLIRKYFYMKTVIEFVFKANNPQKMQK